MYLCCVIKQPLELAATAIRRNEMKAINFLNGVEAKCERLDDFLAFDAQGEWKGDFFVTDDEEAEIIRTMAEEEKVQDSVVVKPYYTYKVVYNDDCNSDSQGVEESLEECMSRIEYDKSSSDSYYADYKGGNVSVYCVETEEEVYCEVIPE